MQILKETVGQSEETKFFLEHKDERLSWYRKPFKTLKMEDNIVRDINGFWSRLPEESQDAIWEVYKTVDQILFEVRNPQLLNDKIREQVKILFDLMPQDKAIFYIRRHSNVAFPPDMKENESQMTENDTLMLTYFREDYEELASFSMLMKAFLPIMNNYLALTGDGYSPENRFYMGVKLLHLSNMLERPAYKRLLSYTSHFYKGNSKPMAGSALLAGLSSTEVDNWLAAKVIYHTIAPGVIAQKGEVLKDTVVGIFHTVSTLSDDLAKHFQDRVTEKTLPKGSGDDEDKTSVVENYKTKQDINEGDLVSHEFQAHSEDVVARDIHAMYNMSFDEELYWKLYQFAKSSEVEINQFHRSICQIVLNGVVSPRAMYYIDYPGMLNYLVITQMILIKWGFNTIAQLMLSNAEVKRSVLVTVTRTSMSNEQLDKLDILYPHHLPSVSQKLATRKRANVAANDVERLTSEFATTHWSIKLPEDLYAHFGYRGIMTIPFPASMEYDLVNLLIHVAELKQSKQPVNQ